MRQRKNENDAHYLWRVTIETERERCAKIAERYGLLLSGRDRWVATNIAELIRDGTSKN